MSNITLPLTYTTFYSIVHTANADSSQMADDWNIKHFNAGKIDLGTIWCGFNGSWITIGY